VTRPRRRRRAPLCIVHWSAATSGNVRATTAASWPAGPSAGQGKCCRPWPAVTAGRERGV